MHIHLDLQNQTKFEISSKKFLRITKRVLSKYFNYTNKEIFISVFLVEPEKMKELNKKYRNRNKPTTVLSFPQDEPLKKNTTNEKMVLGDIFLCPAIIKEQSQEKVCYFFIHGLHHLLGLNHNQMEKLETQINLVEDKPSLSNSFKCAFRGIWEALVSERNLRLHFMIAAFIIASGFILHISRLEWLFVFVAIALVVVMEMVNTATEKILDLIHPNYDRNVRYIKDVFASVVLISAFTAVVIGLIIIVPKIIALF